MKLEAENLILYHVSIFIFCVPIICATNIFVLVIRCKGPYILSWINVGGYNVRQDDGVTVGEAPLTSYVYSSGCLWWRAGFMF